MAVLADVERRAGLRAEDEHQKDDQAAGQEGDIGQQVFLAEHRFGGGWAREAIECDRWRRRSGPRLKGRSI